MSAIEIAIGRVSLTRKDCWSAIEEVAGRMTLVWITIAAYWFVIVLFMMALCRAAARGDTVLAVA